MDSSGIETRASHAQLAAAVHRNSALSSEGALERLFTFLFSGLVYPQIWEDPVVDMDALEGLPPDLADDADEMDHRVATRASLRQRTRVQHGAPDGPDRRIQAAEPA